MRHRLFAGGARQLPQLASCWRTLGSTRPARQPLLAPTPAIAGYARRPVGPEALLGRSLSSPPAESKRYPARQDFHSALFVLLPSAEVDRERTQARRGKASGRARVTAHPALLGGSESLRVELASCRWWLPAADLWSPRPAQQLSRPDCCHRGFCGGSVGPWALLKEYSLHSSQANSEPFRSSASMAAGSRPPAATDDIQQGASRRQSRGPLPSRDRPCASERLCEVCIRPRHSPSGGERGREWHQNLNTHMAGPIIPYFRLALGMLPRERLPCCKEWLREAAPFVPNRANGRC